MNSQLTPDQVAQMAPMLGSVARILASGTQLSDGQAQTLLVGAGLDGIAAAANEVMRWARLLTALRDDPIEEQRRATVEALLLRGLPEASVLLAVTLIAGRPAPTAPIEIERQGHSAPKEQSIAAADVSSADRSDQRLRISVSSLDLRDLPAGRIAIGEFDVHGGTGHIIAESDQVVVTPPLFGPGRTRIQVQVRPVEEGLVWTTLRLVTAAETVELPILAQWASANASAPRSVNHMTDSAVICSSCGNANAAEDIYCQQCAFQLLADRACPYCNGAIPANSRYCPECGREL